MMSALEEALAELERARILQIEEIANRRFV